MAESQIKPERRYELDWLRVLIILHLIPYHATWCIQIPESIVVGFYRGFPVGWHMPLLFFLAGTAARTALQSRCAREYLKERVKRLLVPLMFYVIFLNPIQSYFNPDVDHSGGLCGYLVNFWPNHLLHTPGWFPRWVHLWFVLYLFIFSVITLPAFVYLSGQPQKKSEQSVSTFIRKKWSLYLPALPLALIFFGLVPVLGWYKMDLINDWPFFGYNLILYVYGFVFCFSTRFWAWGDRHKRSFLLLGIISNIAVLYGWQRMVESPAYTMDFMLYAVLFGLNTWFWCVGLLGFARKYLSYTNRFLQYFSRASYPIYIIHFVVVAVLGHFVVQWCSGIFTRLFVLSTLSFVAIVLMYEILIKRTRVTRFLFGMKA